MATKGSRRSLGATDGRLKLGDYALGSIQSRAVARSLLESRRTTEDTGILFRLRRIGKASDPDRKCTCKRPPAGMVVFCRCFVPEKEEQQASSMLVRRAQ
jgi:hypothetical protein